MINEQKSSVSGASMTSELCAVNFISCSWCIQNSREWRVHLKNCGAAKFFCKGFHQHFKSGHHLTAFDMFNKQFQLALSMIGHDSAFPFHSEP